MVRPHWPPSGATIVLLALCLCAGCAQKGAVQVGSPDKPAVQVGPASRPMVEAKVQVGPTSGPAVQAEAKVLSPEIDISSSNATSQPANQSAGNLTAAEGAQQRQIAVNLNASGSGWPLVAVGGLLLGLVLAVLYLRLHVVAGKRDSLNRQMASRAFDSREQEFRDRQKLLANAQAVARSIGQLGPGPQRDRLLALIAGALPDRASWDVAIHPYGVSRSARAIPSAPARSPQIGGTKPG